jgi:hypothetical protein
MTRVINIGQNRMLRIESISNKVLITYLRSNGSIVPGCKFWLPIWVLRWLLKFKNDVAEEIKSD